MAKRRMYRNDDVEKALRGVREIIDLDGEDHYEESDLHPGAVLVTFNGLTQSVAVIDGSGDGDEVDRDDAVAAAEQYMEDRSLISSGQRHSYVFVLEQDDAPGFLSEEQADEIKSDIERVLNEMANQRAAESFSTMFDDDYSTLEDLGYDPDDVAYKIAEFGYENGVDGDLLVGPGWYEDLGLKKTREVQTWREAKAKDPPHHNAITRLYDWLRAGGYEIVPRMGGRVPGGEEEELDADHVVEAVAGSLGNTVTQEQIEKVLEDEFNVSGGQIYWSSDSGDTEMWAKPKARVHLVIRFVHTDSDDWSTEHGAVVVADTESEAEDAFKSAVEGGDDAFWSQEALDSGDSPERLESYSTPLAQQGWYMSWQDYEGSLSDEELAEAQETDEWPEIEASTEMIQVKEVRVLEDPDSAEAAAEHLDVIWEHDVDD